MKPIPAAIPAVCKQIETDLREQNNWKWGSKSEHTDLNQVLPTSVIKSQMVSLLARQSQLSYCEFGRGYTDIV